MSNEIFSYTNRSLENSRREGMSKIPLISRGDYTDMNPTDPGMIILDYVHSLVDMINFYQDHQALETFLTTAKERKNIFRIAKQLSYKIHSAKGATVDLEFYIDEYHSETVKIPRYTKVRTKKNIQFITVEDAYISAGELSVTVPAVQGEFVTESYKGTGISRYSNVERPENQSYTLKREYVDIDSISIRDSFNRYWTPVDYVIFSMDDEYVYEKNLNPDDSVTISFGDGVRGKIPQTTDTLYIDYIATLADAGKTGAETITILVDSLYDLVGEPVLVRVTNRQSTTGGSKPPTEEEIRAYAPGIVKSQDRAVTIEDFRNLARSIDGVADAVAYDINNAPPDMGIQFYEVKVVILPEVGTEVNASLIKRVYDYLYSRMIPPTNLQVIAPGEDFIDIDINIVKRTAVVEGGIEESVREAIKEYFYSRYSAIGMSFNPNELISVLSNVQGVSYVDSMTPNKIINVSSTHVLRVRNINVNIL